MGATDSVRVDPRTAPGRVRLPDGRIVEVCSVYEDELIVDDGQWCETVLEEEVTDVWEQLELWTE